MRLSQHSKRPWRSVCWSSCRIWGDMHRRNGPAMEHDNGNKSWYVDGRIVMVETGTMIRERMSSL